MTTLNPQVSVTRPANTTQYAAGEVVGHETGDALEFFSESSGVIKAVVLIDSAAEATKPELDLFLFAAEPTVANDNAAFAPTDAQMKDLVAVFSFVGTSGTNFKTGATGNGAMQQTGFEIAYAAPERKLYGVLVARNAYTPVSAEVFTVKLTIQSD